MVEDIAPPTERQPVGAGILRRPLTLEEQKRVSSLTERVRQHARISSRKWRKDRNDLFQGGMFATCLAAIDWTPEGGASWETFGMRRAEGAIFDMCEAEHLGRVRVSAMARGAAIAVGVVHYDISLAERTMESPEQVKAREVEGTLAVMGGSLVGLLHREESPEDDAAISQEREQMRAALRPLLAKLEPEELRLVEEVVVGDEPLASVARSMGWEYHPARDRLRWVLAKLGRQLKGLMESLGQ